MQPQMLLTAPHRGYCHHLSSCPHTESNMAAALELLVAARASTLGSQEVHTARLERSIQKPLQLENASARPRSLDGAPIPKIVRFTVKLHFVCALHGSFPEMHREERNDQEQGKCVQRCPWMALNSVAWLGMQVWCPCFEGPGLRTSLPLVQHQFPWILPP